MKRHIAAVRSVEKMRHGVSCIHFDVPDGRFHYTPGQYITIFFEGASQMAGKAYSLAGLPGDQHHQIIVKNIGEFSGRLCALKPGDTFECSSGYGHLNPETDRPLVCITGGTGVSPVWSIIREGLAHNPDRQVKLIESYKSVSAMPLRRHVRQHALRHKNLTVHTHITRQSAPPKSMKKGRVDLEEYLKDVAEDAVYIVCGSVDFVRSMWQTLTARGVPAHDISAESFFE